MKPHWQDRIERRAEAALYVVLALVLGVPMALIFFMAAMAQ